MLEFFLNKIKDILISIGWGFEKSVINHQQPHMREDERRNTRQCENNQCLRPKRAALKGQHPILKDRNRLTWMRNPKHQHQKK